MTERVVRSINDAVRGLYEAYPYPDYSLFIPLRWQEAYASGSLFARRLAESKGLSGTVTNKARRVLIAGCGDIQAAVISRWEPRAHAMMGFDLSRASLQKARIRSWLLLRPMKLWAYNLEDPQQPIGGPYAHVDAYGMLHHLANPAAGLHRLSQALDPGGTMRIMVYNSRARQWIFHLARVFALLGLSAYEHPDLATASRLLRLFAQTLPALTERLEAMESIIQQPARLVDAFFHPREARLSLSYWLEAIESSGLQILGLVDRYAELDDLPNPLLHMPRRDQLEARMDDLRFENNIELYLYKPQQQAGRGSLSYAAPWHLRRRFPPQAWTRYAETRSLGALQLWSLWQAFLTRNFMGQGQTLDRWARRVNPSALQRLSRVGALFPDQFQSRPLQTLLVEPMQDAMEAPITPEPRPLQNAPILQRRLEEILIQKKLPLARLDIMGERLLRAQKP